MLCMSSLELIPLAGPRPVHKGSRNPCTGTWPGTDEQRVGKQKEQRQPESSFSLVFPLPNKQLKNHRIIQTSTAEIRLS